MGGKHKQANRTKNNARPSSSSHSAELLGNTIPTFFGFSSVKDGMSAVSGFQTDELSINSDFQIMFKQMNKKDPTTRFKALQAFADLCNKTDVNAVKAILPLWPRMYCSLCTDINHKVRESAHHAHHAVVSKVKKSIAPYLKEIAGPWFTSQYDTYAPAASAASLAFEEAFPSTKLNKAIMFCQEEILSYIYDNLINQTPQTLSNPNTTSPEDMQAKYERIIIASLQGYTLYLQKLSSDQIKEAEESNRKLLSNGKFWKYSKNKVALIRSCFFHTLIALCQRAIFLLQGESSKLSSAIFNNLDESDPVVLHAVWDAALNVLVSIEDCWSHINIEKQVFAKLNLVLKNGGRNVLTIYPNILPLLSKLPEDSIKDKETFYANLFGNMRCGLDVGGHGQSASDVKIAATTFVECLRYVIMKNCTDSEFCVKLVTEQLIPALKDKLHSRKSSAAFLIQTSSLVHYWHGRNEPVTYKTLVEVFFTSLFHVYNTQVDSEVTRTSLADVLNNQMEFLAILINPSQYAPKNKGRVKFEVDDDAGDVEVVKTEADDAEFIQEMLPLAKKLAVVYFKRTIEKEERRYIPAIRKLVELFDPRVIFEEIVVAVDESTCFKLFTSYFSKWLMDQDMKCGDLVDLSFCLLKHVTDDEKEYILEEFCNNWFCDSLQLNVCKALPNYSEDDCIVRWVRSERFANSIVKLIERFIESDGDDVTSRDVIVMLLQAKRANGDFIIESSTVGSVMESVTRALGEITPKLHVVELSQDLILNAKFEQANQPPYEALVASLFKLWCYYPETENLTRACKTGLQTVVSNCLKRGRGFEFTRNLSSGVGDIIINDEIEFSLERIVANVNTYVEIATNTNLSDCCSSNGEIAEAMEVVKMFLEEKPSWGDEGVKMLEKCNRVGFEGSGDLNFEYLKLENDKWEQNPRFDLKIVKKYTKWNLYLGGVLNLIAGAHPRTFKTSALYHVPKIYSFENENAVVEDDDIIPVKITKDEEEKLKADLEVIESVFHESDYDEENTLEPLLDDVREFLLSVGLLEAFNKYYASTKHYRELKDSGGRLKSLACELLRNVNLVELKFIYDHCRIFIRRQSLWWVLRPTFVEVFHRKFLECKNETTAEGILQEMKNIRRKPVRRRDYLNLFTLVEKGFEHRFTEQQWEEIFLYLNDFFEEFLPKSEITDSDLLLLSSVARLYHKLSAVFRENHARSADVRLPPETCLAWNEVVQVEVYNKFVQGWRKVAQESYNREDVPPETIVVLQNVSDVVIDGLNLRRSADLKESVELEVECGKLMTSCHAVVQMTAFRLCLSVIPDLVKLDTEMFGNQVTEMFQDKDAKDAKDTSALFNKSSNGDWTAKNLTEDILHIQGIVETLLSDFIVGDCCIVEPFTDSFNYTYSYLLLWCFLLDMCGDAHSPLRFQYGCWFQEEGYSKTLLESVFKLMPQTVLHGAEANENCQKYFENFGSLDFREPVESERIEQIACFVYRLFLQRLPTVVREWWNQVENKTSNLVEKVTRLYVSPILIANELKNVQQDRETSFDNLEIKTYPGTREVVATYTIEEVKMDLIMTLPQNYPLGTIKIESSNVVVSTSKWRNWLFHICKYLIHQNGTIWDALVIWKTNLDKKFEGVEECYICFSILQGSSFEIPRLCCHTCKKKFHSNCLYKWFSTSNKSTCPICRNLF